jgi:ankyrin repeat protein
MKKKLLAILLALFLGAECYYNLSFANTLTMAPKNNIENEINTINSIPGDSSSYELFGITQLMTAAQYNDLETIRFILKTNISSINQRNLGGSTALHIACRQQHYDSVLLLLQHNANVNIVDSEGWTPLMRAANNGNLKIISLLLLKGAYTHILNKDNETVVIQAARANCDKCVKLITKSDDNLLLLKNIKRLELKLIQDIAFRYRNKKLQSAIDVIIKNKQITTNKTSQRHINQ